jgi:hypothetical protein
VSVMRLYLSTPSPSPSSPPHLLSCHTSIMRF